MIIIKENAKINNKTKNQIKFKQKNLLKIFSRKKLI